MSWRLPCTGGIGALFAPSNSSAWKSSLTTFDTGWPYSWSPKACFLQVWSLTLFLSSPFGRSQILREPIKIINFPVGRVNDPLSGKHFSLPFLPAIPLSLSRTLEGFFELTRDLQGPSPRALLPELQRQKDTVRCAVLGAEVPGHRQQQLTQTLVVRLLKTHFFSPILDCKKSTEYN